MPHHTIFTRRLTGSLSTVWDAGLAKALQSTRRWQSICVVRTLLLIGTSLLACSTAAVAQEPLRVGIWSAPPLAFDYGDSSTPPDQREGGSTVAGEEGAGEESAGEESVAAGETPSMDPSTRYGGIAVELWQDIAVAEELDFRWVPVAEEAALEKLQAGELDLVLSAVPRAEQIGAIHYSQPYLTTHLAAMMRNGDKTIWKYVSALLNHRFWLTVMWLSLLLTVVGMVCWLLERRDNEEQFRRRPLSGIWDGFYWAGVTMSTIGYGDQTPKTNGGRALALVWMLIAMAVTSTLTASIVSVVQKTNAGLQIEQVPDDLRSMKVAVASGDYAASYLREHGIQPQEEPDLVAAVKALMKEEVAAVVAMRAGLAAAQSATGDEGLGGALSQELRIMTTRLKPQGYSFALNTQQDELLDKIDRQLLLQTRDAEWDPLVNRFLQSDRDER